MAKFVVVFERVSEAGLLVLQEQLTVHAPQGDAAIQHVRTLFGFDRGYWESYYRKMGLPDLAVAQMVGEREVEHRDIRIVSVDQVKR